MNDKLREGAKRVPWTGLLITLLIGYLMFHENPGHRKLGGVLQAIFLKK